MYSAPSFVRRKTFTDLRLASWETQHRILRLDGTLEDDIGQADVLRWEIQRRDEETHELIFVVGAFVMSARLHIDLRGDAHDRWTIAWVEDGCARRFLGKDFDENSANDLVRAYYVRFLRTGRLWP